MSTPTALRRAVSLLLIGAIWVLTLLGSFAAVLAAYFGRANWGDGQPPDPWPFTLLLLAIAVLAPLAAAWITQILWRRAGTS
jgi:hypothetical protein